MNGKHSSKDSTFFFSEGKAFINLIKEYYTLIISLTFLRFLTSCSVPFASMNLTMTEIGMTNIEDSARNQPIASPHEG